MTTNNQHTSGVGGLEDFVLAELAKERLASGEKRVRAGYRKTDQEQINEH